MDECAGKRQEEITEAEQIKEKKIKKNEDSLRDLWDNIKCTNSCYYRCPTRRREKQLSEQGREFI